MPPALHEYLHSTILPQYDAFTDGHDRSHVDMVLRESLYLARKYGADEDMLSVAAAFHDLGMPQGRKTHHLTSARLFLADPVMPQFFTDAQRTVIAEAIEDHRASAGSPPRSLCGRILADADHFIVPEDILRRTLLYGKTNFPALTPEEHIARVRQHLQEKFLSGGYLRFWLNDPRSLAGLDALRALAADEPRLRAACEKYL